MIKIFNKKLKLGIQKNLILINKIEAIDFFSTFLIAWALDVHKPIFLYAFESSVTGVKFFLFQYIHNFNANTNSKIKVK
jgi:hypothetical protein